MTDQSVAFSDLLKTHGYSMTKQRRELFDLLAGREPISMRELCEEAAGSMDRASVYRTVAVFEHIGVVHRVNIGWKYKIELSDAFTEHHHHLTCLHCKKIIPINEAALETFIDRLSASHHFQSTRHQIEIQGYCASCQQITSN